MLTQLAAELSRKLLNYRNNTYLTDKVKIGNYVIVPDRLTLKSFSSIHSALACVLNIQDHCVTLKLTNNQTVTRQITDIVNFDNHHPTRHNIDILDLPLFHETDELMEPESQFSILPNEITLEVIHGQESGDPPPEFNHVGDEIDIQVTNDSPQQDNHLLDVQDEIGLEPTSTSMLKLSNPKSIKQQTKTKKHTKFKKYAKNSKEVTDELASTPVQVIAKPTRKSNRIKNKIGH